MFTDILKGVFPQQLAFLEDKLELWSLVLLLPVPCSIQYFEE